MLALVIVPGVAGAVAGSESAASVSFAQADACGDLVSQVLCTTWTFIGGVVAFMQTEAAWATATASHVLHGGF